MEIVEHALLFLHFIGLAAVFGGLFVQVSSHPRLVNNAVVHGILTQLVTGVLLVGANEMNDEHVNNAKVGVKLVVALVIAALAFANRRKPAVADGIFFAMIGLTALNIAVAVFW